MEKKLSIIKEINLKDYTFNLKSETTGKYSVHDSYRDNYNNGFLVKINAPADVNNALKDIFYATDRGVLISNKDFNNKIIVIRNELLSQNFPGKELKDLPKEDRLKIERESAKNVLKELFISESTRLIYSPELSQLKKEYEDDYRLKYLPSEFKIIFYKPEAGDDLDKKESGTIKPKVKKEFTPLYLEVSQKLEPLVEQAKSSHNLDTLELTILEIDKYYENLAQQVENDIDTTVLFVNTKQLLSDEVTLIRQEQLKFEAYLNNIIDDLLAKKDFKKIKPLMREIEQKFAGNINLNQDTKANSLKDLALEKLNNIGKVISLILLKDWENKNFQLSETLINQNLPLELETILKKKQLQEEAKLKVEEEKLLEIDVMDIESIFKRFKDLVRYKKVFISFFDMLTANGFENLNENIPQLKDNYTAFIILLANNLPFEKFSLFWKSLAPHLILKIVSGSFPYTAFNNNKLINLFFETFISKAAPEIVPEVFRKIKTTIIRALEASLLLQIIQKLRALDEETGDLLKKVYPDKLLELTALEDVDYDSFLRSILIDALMKWFPTLDTSQTEFTEILVKFPMQAINRIRKKQINEITPEFTLQLIEKLDNNKEALQFLLYRLGREKYDAALKVKLLEMVGENPNNAENHYNLGITYINTKDFSAAVPELKRAIGIKPEFPEAHYNLGVAYERLGQLDLAMIQYKKAISQRYGYIEAFYNLGLLFHKLKDIPLAVQQFKKILKLEPDNYDAAISLGIAFDEMGELDNATKEYERALAINPEKTTALINLANCYSLKGKKDEAIELYNKAVTIEPENATAQYNLGILYQQQENYNMAKAHYKLAIRFKPDYSEAYNNLGLIYFFNVKVPKAIELWQKSIELNNNIDAYNNLGWGYYVEGKLDEAADIYEKAKKINPLHSILSLNLGTVYYKKNDIPKAIRELENYLFLEPDASNTHDVVKILKSLKITK